MSRATSGDDASRRLYRAGIPVGLGNGSSRTVDAQLFDWPDEVRLNFADDDFDRLFLWGRPLEPVLNVLRTVRHTTGGLYRVRRAAASSDAVAVYGDFCFNPSAGIGTHPLCVAAAIVGSDGVPHVVTGDDLRALPAALASARRLVVRNDPSEWPGMADRLVVIPNFRGVGRFTETALAASARLLLDEYRRRDRKSDGCWDEFDDL